MEIKCDAQMTCGLLLSEVIRNMQQRGEDVQRVAGLKSRPHTSFFSKTGLIDDWLFGEGRESSSSTASQSRKDSFDGNKFVGRECIDFWLTCYDRSVHPLRAHPHL